MSIRCDSLVRLLGGLEVCLGRAVLVPVLGGREKGRENQIFGLYSIGMGNRRMVLLLTAIASELAFK